MKWLPRLVGVIAGGALMLSTMATAEPLKVGEEAPDFLMAATTGGEVRLSDFRGKSMVLIEFYHADFGPT